MSEQVQGFANANAEGVDVSAVLNNLSQQLVQVISGASNNALPIAGHTVAAARSSLAQSSNIAREAQSFVHGNPVGEDYVLRPGDSLEFRLEAGDKG
jgi:hypothetical protein